MIINRTESPPAPPRIVVLALQLALLACASCNKPAPAEGLGQAAPPPTPPPEIPPLESRVGRLDKVADIAVPTGAPGAAFGVAGDGAEYAVGGSDGAVLLVPMAGGAPRVLVDHKETVSRVVFTPDGQWVVSASEDNAIVVWNRKSGQVERGFRAHSANVRALAVSTDSTLIASGSVADDVRVWRLGDGERIAEFEGPSADVTDVTFSPTGQHVFSGSRDSQVRRWSLDRGKPDARNLSLDSTVVALRWSPTRQTLYALSVLGELSWIDPTAFEVRHKRRVVRSRAADLAVGLDGTLAVLTRAGQLALWSPDPKAHDPKSPPFVAHEAGAVQVRFAPSGGTVLTLGSDGSVGFWAVATGLASEAARPMPPVNGEVQAVALQPMGSRGAVASQGRLLLLDADLPDAGQGAPSPDLGPGGISALSYTADGQHLLVGRHNGHVLTLDAANPTSPQGDHAVHDGTVRHIRPGASGDTIWTAGDDIVVQELDAATWEVRRTFKDHTSPIIELAVDPTGRRVATTEDNRITLVRNLETGETEWRRRGHTISELAFSPDGETIAMVEGRRDIHLMEVADRFEVFKIKGTAGLIRDLAWHRGGEMLVLVDDQGAVRVWAVDRGNQLTSADAGRGRPAALALGGADGTLVLTGGMDPRGSAKLFRLAPPAP